MGMTARQLREALDALPEPLLDIDVEIHLPYHLDVDNHTVHISRMDISYSTDAGPFRENSIQFVIQ